METIKLKISGMTCDHCKMAVTKSLQSVPGVSAVDVDLQSNSAKVTYDPGKANLNAFKEAVDDAGYQMTGS
jgi:copper chaperone